MNSAGKMKDNNLAHLKIQSPSPLWFLGWVFNCGYNISICFGIRLSQPTVPSSLWLFPAYPEKGLSPQNTGGKLVNSSPQTLSYQSSSGWPFALGGVNTVLTTSFRTNVLRLGFEHGDFVITSVYVVRIPFFSGVTVVSKLVTTAEFAICSFFLFTSALVVNSLGLFFYTFYSPNKRKGCAACLLLNAWAAVAMFAVQMAAVHCVAGA